MSKDLADRTLEAVCRRIAPAAYEPDLVDLDAIDLAAAVEQRLADGDPALRARIRTLLVVFGHPLTTLVTTGTPRAFAELGPARQDAALRAWERSRLPPRRAAFQALRRLVLATWYALPSSHAALGYLGPYHRREPVYAWEGPLPGVTTDAEPIARTASAPTPPPDVLQRVASARELDDGSRIRAEVCVIGSGAGGAVAAARLAAAGLDVVLLEEGGAWPRTARDEDEASMTARLYADGGARFTDDLAVLLLQGRGIGGGSTVNWMITLRPDPRVMDEWERLHGATLLGAPSLGPELDRIEDEIHARLVPDDAHAPANRIILDGAARLGWRAEPARINARGCLRTGFCGLGCRYGAKQDVVETYLRPAVDAGARILADARATRIAAGAGAAPHRVDAAVLDPAGRTMRSFAVEAGTVVIAAGAVGTPVLLRRSGLGNDVVGSFLRLHPTTAVVGRYDEVVYAAAGIPQSSVCTEFVDGNDGYGFWIECPPMLPALSAASLPGFGAAHRARVRQFAHLASLIVLVRDGGATDASQGEVRLDRHGRIAIRYRLRDSEWRAIDDGVRAAARLHLAAGAVEAFSLHTTAPSFRSEHDVAAARLPRGPNRITLFSAHVNGTCRMGRDRRTSACTPDGALRGTRGIYVCDGSLFPTAPGVNPQATIMALASLVARGIIDRRPRS